MVMKMSLPFTLDLGLAEEPGFNGLPGDTQQQQSNMDCRSLWWRYHVSLCSFMNAVPWRKTSSVATTDKRILFRLLLAGMTE